MRNEIAKEIINTLKDIGYLLPGLETPHQYLRRINRATYYGVVTRLEKQGLVKKERQGRKNKIVLTEKGKKYVFNNEPVSVEARKDGLSTVIIFDIPEYLKRERKFFRRKLLQYKFTSIQKSVLISPYKYPRVLLKTEKELGINKYISHLSGRIDHI